MENLSTGEEEINLPDKYAQLLESSIKESRELRKALVERDQLLQRTVKTLEDQLKSSRTKRTKQTLEVPQLCKADFRSMYNLKLNKDNTFHGFDVTKSLKAEENHSIVARVVKLVQEDHGGVKECPWTPAQLKGAGSIYFKSLYDAHVRKRNGKYKEHLIACRRQGRIRDKTERRIKALLLMNDWTEKKKKDVRAVLTKDYQSSDDSEWSEDEAGPILTGYVTKKLPWERTRLTKYKKELDLAYLKSLPARTRSMLVKRKLGKERSIRPRPIDAQDWAVRKEDQNLLSSTPSVSKSNYVHESLNISPINNEF